jgi:probable HAF family extracellular repeat protein
MRRSLFVVASATLLASCEIPRLPSQPEDRLHLIGTTARADDPLLNWERSTTNVPMFNMGQFNGLNVIPLDVNDAGQVIGILRSPQPPFGVPDRAFVWQNGTFTELVPAPPPAKIARAINTSGIVAGTSGITAVMWTASGMTTLPGGNNGVTANGINDQGDVVGADFLTAVRWTNAVRTALPNPGGTGSSAVAFDINSSGVIAGRMTATSPPFGRPMLWQNGVATVIALPAGSELRNPHAFQSRILNDAGEWIGNLQNGGTIRGARYRNGAFETLPILSAGSQSFAIGISETGEIVGTSPSESGAMHAVMWSTDNVIRDLGTPPEGTSSTANAMNRNGWVVGTSVSVVDGVSRTVGVIWRVTGDDTPPEITPTVQGTLGTNGWYTSDVQVTWTVTDAESEIPNRNGCDVRVFAADGEVTYTCSAINSADLAATSSVTVRRDASPPDIAPTVGGTQGQNGWYTSDVSVTRVVGDDNSGIASSEGCETQTVATDTPELTLTCVVTNGAGLTSTNAVTVKRDATPPVVTFSDHPPTYDVDAHISIHCSATDAMSGIASHTCANLERDAYTFGVDSHEQSVQAIDNAGNSTTVTTRFQIVVTLAGLTNLTRRLVTDPGLANALIQKLEHAAVAMERGQTRTAQNLLDAYAQQVRAQAGKKIGEADAGSLIGFSDAIQ